VPVNNLAAPYCEALPVKVVANPPVGVQVCDSALLDDNGLAWQLERLDSAFLGLVELAQNVLVHLIVFLELPKCATGSFVQGELPCLNTTLAGGNGLLEEYLLFFFQQTLELLDQAELRLICGPCILVTAVQVFETGNAAQVGTLLLRLGHQIGQLQLAFRVLSALHCFEKLASPPLGSLESKPKLCDLFGGSSNRWVFPAVVFAGIGDTICNF